MRQLLPPLGAALILLIVQTVPLTAQQETTTLGGAEAKIVHSEDLVHVLKVQGPTVNARATDFPDLHLQWYVVQDSSMGLVFQEPSGLKIDNQREYDADINLEALRSVHAFEIRALTFNVWDEHVGTFQTTYRADFEFEDEGDFDPRWVDFRGEDHRHLTSIIYISRVRHSDGSITEANTDPVHHIAEQIDGSYTPEPQEKDWEELLELWRKFLKQLEGWSPPASVTAASSGPASGGISNRQER
jgi:hypothetical protein